MHLRFPFIFDTHWFLFIASVFTLVDLALLVILPQLQLSYGPVLPAWLTLEVVRGGMVVAPLLAYKLTRRWKRVQLPTRVFTFGWLIVHSLLLILFIDALLIEPFHLTVTTLSLPLRSDSSPLATITEIQPRIGQPLRILQITDLHIERLNHIDYEVLDTIQSLNPDVIVLTGDYVNAFYQDDPKALADGRWFMSQLHAPLGIFATDGNGDDEKIMTKLFTGLDQITVLDDQVLRIPGSDAGGTHLPIYLIGLSYRSESRVNTNVLRKLTAQIPPDAYTLLLHHTPDQILEASKLGIDLYLAGHTHGGQVRLPFYGSIITFSNFGKQFDQGLYIMGSTQLYVSNGLGMAGSIVPRARFLCPPEILFLSLN
jgi:uncharacterized protein